MCDNKICECEGFRVYVFRVCKIDEEITDV